MSGDPQTCWFGPYPFPTQPSPFQSPGFYPPNWSTTGATFPTIVSSKLSDDDVERIARRVAEILREPKP